MGRMTSGTVTCSPPAQTSRLYDARRANSLSREELAALAGLSPRTIYAIEVEGVRPQRATRRVLALALACATEDLFPNDALHAGGPGSPCEGTTHRPAARVQRAGGERR